MDDAIAIFMVVICFVSLFLLGFVVGLRYQARRLQEAGIIEIVDGQMKAREQ